MYVTSSFTLPLCDYPETHYFLGFSSWMKSHLFSVVGGWDAHIANWFPLSVSFSHSSAILFVPPKHTCWVFTSVSAVPPWLHAASLQVRFLLSSEQITTWVVLCLCWNHAVSFNQVISQLQVKVRSAWIMAVLLACCVTVGPTHGHSDSPHTHFRNECSNAHLLVWEA